MENTLHSKQHKISTLVSGFCQNHLDDEYIRLCTDLFNDLLKYDPEVFKRGNEEIWAAAIVWAIGSVNFLGDKDFEPYASLSDVCEYFNASTSTVGQKASKIREWLDIDFFNDKFQREDSQISDLLGNLAMTEEGFIVPVKPFKVKNKEVEFVEEDEEELPENYIIILESKYPIKNADIYQLEYLFKSVLEKDEKFQKSKLVEKGGLHIYFYGRPAKVLKFEKKISHKNFQVVDVVNQAVS
ncbi:MAG: hypothetical protein H8D45_28000 [Bacteroidetes bacterium]|nr:hypothetical protein [Bacteroidota bacterium]MBL7104281.1 hypothetical protein [Bacteroidales bacterium]